MSCRTTSCKSSSNDAPLATGRCRANRARIRLSRPHSGHGFQVEALKTVVVARQPTSTTTKCAPRERMTLKEFNPPWREGGPPNHHDDKVNSDLNDDEVLAARANDAPQQRDQLRVLVVQRRQEPLHPLHVSQCKNNYFA